MTIKQLIQGSPEWLAFRKTRIGSSDSAALMGVCPYKTAYELYQEKKDPNFKSYVSTAMSEGTRKEPIVRAWFNERTGDFYAPKVVIHPIYELIHSSLDGITFFGEKAIEIKSPGEKAFHEIVKNGIPDNYFCQCQHHMMCAGLDEIIFIAWLDENNFHIEQIDRDEQYILKLLDKILEFLECLKNNTPPKQTKRKTKVDYEYTDDIEIKFLITTIAETRKCIALHEEVEANARAELQRRSAGRNLCGDGFQLYYSTTKGAIDYARVPELKGLDLEPFRKPSYEKFTVKVE